MNGKEVFLLNLALLRNEITLKCATQQKINSDTSVGYITSMSTKELIKKIQVITILEGAKISQLVMILF